MNGSSGSLQRESRSDEIEVDVGPGSLVGGGGGGCLLHADRDGREAAVGSVDGMVDGARASLCDLDRKHARNSPIKQDGFTLLEVMVAIAIMAVLSFLTAQALKSGVENRAFVSRELGRDAKLADTLRIMRADIAQAFHYHNVFCDLDRDVNGTPTPAPGIAGQESIPVGGFAPAGFGGTTAAATPKPCPPDPSGFIGDSESVYFTALSNVRTLRDSRESDQAKIGYFTKSCKARGTKNAANTKCLYRAVSPYIDQDVDKPGPETLLLENVEEFKLRYLGPEREDFVEQWKYGKGGDAISKDKFPYAIEITLTIHDKNDPKDRPATQTVLAPIYFENNPKKQKPADPNAPGGGANGSPPGQQGVAPQSR